MIWTPQKQCFEVKDIYTWASCVIKLLRKFSKHTLPGLNQKLLSLSYLAKKGDFYELFTEDQRDFIDQIEPLNIEARYPSHKERLMKSLTEEKCTEILKKTKELQLWIKEKL